MDEMKITSSFTRKLAATVIKKLVKKNFGYDIELTLNNIYITVDDSNVAHVHVDANADINSNDLKKMVDGI